MDTVKISDVAVDLPAEMEAERAWEEQALAEGAKRFRDRLEKAMARPDYQKGRDATVGAARKLLQGGLEPLEAAIRAYLEESKTRRGPRHVALKWIEALGPEVSAYLTLKTVLNLIARRTSLRTVAKNIAELIVDELRYRRFQEKEPKLFEYRMARFNTGSYSHMARSLDAAIHHADVDVSDLELTAPTKILIGMKLIDLLVASTEGLVQIEEVWLPKEPGRKPKSETLLTGTEQTLTWLSERNEALQALFPVNLPMIVPPIPWGPGKSGGYRFALRGKHKLVRGSRGAHRDLIRRADMPKVYAALNRIQETAWRINPAVLELVQRIAESGGGVAGVPSMEDSPMPTKPADIDTNEEARRVWRRKAHLAKEANHIRKMRAMDFYRVLDLALKVADKPAIWFPHNLDFRGRVYPLTSYLHPQGDDLCKALLTFADGKRLGPDGIGWLALHGANALGETPDKVKLSKQTLQERVDWIIAHSTEIVRVAEDPLGDLWWTKADEPLVFFAFCVEWTGFCRAEAEGRGEDYVCSLPCAMDGTCNGLQHFSAMFLDPVGAEAVNVVPTERPQDIYQRIADVVLDRLQKEATEQPLAALWLRSGLVNRKLTKRPTMTFGYGSKKYGFSKQIQEFVSGLDTWGSTLLPLFTEEQPDGKQKPLLPAASAYMAGLIWEALGEIVVAAQRGMDWMQKAAGLVAKTGRCVGWTVPGTGFPVVQNYMEEKMTQVKTVLAGSLYKPAVFTATDKPDVRKQASAVAPNIVHSLDAAALMLTVCDASAAGVESFAMIHDSYGTLAADCPVLAGCTRQALYNLYTSSDVVGSLSAQFQQQVVDGGGDLGEYPLPPPKGTLDLSGVLASDYFFS